MYLLRIELQRFGHFDQLSVSFEGGEAPRLMTVIYGGGGVGKTTLLSAIANTRPGLAAISHGLIREDEEPGQVVCEYHLGQDDPERPHPLVIASPNAKVYEEVEQELRRRKEQALFERVAKEQGFMFLALPATRVFSRAPLALTSIGRSLARYDVRTPLHLDDGSRGDLARETKQCLAYAALSHAVAEPGPALARFARLQAAMQQAVDTVGALVGLRWVGLSPVTFEPLFETDGKVEVAFDDLPMRSRQLISFVALPVRALWAACPGRSPLDAEGIVAIDEVELYLDPLTQARLPEALRLALPRVQWLLTTSSPFLASGCDAESVMALRQSEDASRVELYCGELAQLH